MNLDPESAQVALDKAEAGGLLTYPDILGKTVTVESGKPAVELKPGLVEKIGPLGFVVRWEARVTPDWVNVSRRFFPWSVQVSWNEGRSDPIEREIELATADDLDRIALHHLSLRRHHTDRGDPLSQDHESDASFRARVLRELARARLQSAARP